MKISGGCHCGKVHYTAEIDPNQVILCHCTDCQTMSGAPFRGVVVATDTNFELTGTLTCYRKESANSGNPRIQAFCPTCGTHIYASSIDELSDNTPKAFNIRLGTVAEREQLKPTIEIWCDSRQFWIKPIEGATQIARQA